MFKWYLGTMGFGYKQWVGAFYPAGMQPRSYLVHYSQFFDAVEIDSTFYGTPTPDKVRRWAAATPPHFTFCLKTPRAITHDAPLSRGVAAMHAFIDVVALLGPKLGPILIQFGPDFTFDQSSQLDEFLAQLPTDRRFAVEFRHRSWARAETGTLLRKHNICQVAADYLYLPKTIVRTTDFLYLRFIGPHGQYATKDKELVDKTPDLQGWFEQIQQEEGVTAVYAFFNNDYSGHSPATCNRFKRIVGMDVGEIRPYQQRRLF